MQHRGFEYTIVQGIERDHRKRSANVAGILMLGNAVSKGSKRGSRPGDRQGSGAPPVKAGSTRQEGRMTDQQLAVNALRKAGRIIAGYLDPKNPAGPMTSLHALIDVLDTQELAAALDRMEKGFGLKVVK
jgi:hypothetical protein